MAKRQRTPEGGAEPGKRRHAAHADSYKGHKARAAKRSQEISLAGRDIGKLPKRKNKRRWERCRYNLKLFIETYAPEACRLAWSKDHLELLAELQSIILGGGQKAIAMPRGSGKTTLCELACLWAVLYGHRGFVVIIATDEDKASESLEQIRDYLEHSDRLAEDFPAACIPIRKLEGIRQRAGGQLCEGKPTRMVWTEEELGLPHIEGAESSGARLTVAGIRSGKIRGLKRSSSDGGSMRPDLVLMDDPQTDVTANSEAECDRRERIITGAVLGMAGPDTEIAAFGTVTVIRRGDLADRLLNRDNHPEWRGMRTKMVVSFPENQALWDQYAKLFREGLKFNRGTGDATEFYLANKAAMDKGAEVSWPARKGKQTSAIEHAMVLRILRGDPVFFAEFQNDPLDESGALDDLKPEDIEGKFNHIPRGIVPDQATLLVGFIDVQGKVLFWTVYAFAPDFTGWLVDYGVYPKQRAEWNTLREIRYTLNHARPGAGVEAAIHAGIEKLSEELISREWQREDGETQQLNRLGIDSGWMTETVYSACKHSPHRAVIIPTKGRGISAASIPFDEQKRKRGEQVGLNLKVTIAEKGRPRLLMYDTNYWKSFLQARLATPIGDPGAISFYGSKAHKRLARHLTAEYRVRTQGRGREVDEWKPRPEWTDNHWGDGSVGCCAIASLEGVEIAGVQAPTAGRRKRVRGSEMVRRRRRRRQEGE